MGFAGACGARPPVEWTDEMIALLGEASDGDVAAELEIPRKSVAYKRVVLGEG